MIATYVTTVLVILGLLSIWIVVTHLARLHAARHPEFGPLREEGSGCGGLCRCVKGESCQKKTLPKNANPTS